MTSTEWDNFIFRQRKQRKRAQEIAPRALSSLDAAQLEADRREEFDDLTWASLTRAWF